MASTPQRRLAQPTQGILVRQPVSHPQRVCFARDGTLSTRFRNSAHNSQRSFERPTPPSKMGYPGTGGGGEGVSKSKRKSHWGIIFWPKMMSLQGVGHPKPQLGVCYANDPPKKGPKRRLRCACSNKPLRVDFVFSHDSPFGGGGGGFGGGVPPPWFLIILNTPWQGHCIAFRTSPTNGASWQYPMPKQDVSRKYPHPMNDSVGPCAMPRSLSCQDGRVCPCLTGAPPTERNNSHHSSTNGRRGVAFRLTNGQRGSGLQHSPFSRPRRRAA